MFVFMWVRSEQAIGGEVISEPEQLKTQHVHV